MTVTTSLCAECLEVVPAEVVIGKNVVLRKECPVHGVKETIIETSPDVYAAMHTPTSPALFDDINAVILNATDRCNMVCPHCYHMPGNDPDPSIEELVERATTSPCPNIILMGAEPTVRDDLADVIRAIPKPTGIYTNAVRLADREYLEGLIEAGIAYFCVSLHTEKCTANPVIWEKKLQAMQNLRDTGAIVHHVAFSLNTLDDIIDVFKLAEEWWDVGGHTRIRIPYNIGRCGNASFYMSNFLPFVKRQAEVHGWTVERMYDDDSPYHVNLRINGKWFRIIRCPSIDEVDLGELNCPPYCQFDDETGEVNFVYGAIVAAEKKKRRGRV